MKHEAVENAALLHFFKASLKPEHESKFNCISYSLFIREHCYKRKGQLIYIHACMI